MKGDKESLKVSDFIFKFTTRVSLTKMGVCRVRNFVTDNRDVYTLITDISHVYSTISITNVIEDICMSLQERGLVPKGAKFIEHYEADNFQDQRFSLVELIHGRPRWKNEYLSNIKLILQCEEDELIKLTKEDLRLVSEIEKIKYSKNPSHNFNYVQDSNIIKRKYEINESMMSKVELNNLVIEGSNEQDISRKIKKDLSILAEIYAYPKDEYICLSEFPIDDGFVDYIILTGRSRMDVYLIEVKGSDFNIKNKNSSKFNEKISEAIFQMDSRRGFIYRNYEFFKKHIHDIRKRVEKGELVYNSYKGPCNELLVDSEKDINIYSVIIGGRTRDDYIESQLRHNYELNSNSNIKLESWDTFMRKLIRK